jgi:hypothetical protein
MGAEARGTGQAGSMTFSVRSEKAQVKLRTRSSCSDASPPRRKASTAMRAPWSVRLSYALRRCRELMSYACKARVAFWRQIVPTWPKSRVFLGLRSASATQRKC